MARFTKDSLIENSIHKRGFEYQKTGTLKATYIYNIAHYYY